MLRFTSRRLCAAAAASGAVGTTSKVLSKDANTTNTAAAAAVPAELKHTEEDSPDGSAAALKDRETLQRQLREYGLESDGAVLDAEGLPPLPQPSRPYVPPPPFPHRPRKGIETPEYYNSRSAVGHPDQLALELTAGRSDPEWQWLKFLCFICVVPTFGSSLYGIFFAENAKWFKDEPWSPFRN